MAQPGGNFGSSRLFLQAMRLLCTHMEIIRLNTSADRGFTIRRSTVLLVITLVYAGTIGFKNYQRILTRLSASGRRLVRATLEPVLQSRT